jgi:hypothetical protein
MRHVMHLPTVLLTGLFAAPAGADTIGEPSGTGPFPAIAESRADLPAHTVYRPVALPREPLPLYVWGNGGCSDNGLSHSAYLRQIASHGYFVVALGAPGAERGANAGQGPPGAAPSRGAPPPAPPAQPAPAQPAPAGPGGASDPTQPEQMLEAIDWAARETARAGGEFYGRIDVTRIAVGGHSCGGLQALAVSHDPRIATTLVLNSGIYNTPGSGRSRVAIDKSQLARLHAPALYLSGGPTDIAHENAVDDVARIEHVPVFFGALPVGHGGTFFSEPNGGEWASVSTRWLDWQLKADADASWDFASPDCRLCSDERWTVEQKQLPPPTGPFRQSVYVPVRDGTRLAMNVLRPARDGALLSEPQPVIFAFTPYRARYRAANGRISGPSVVRLPPMQNCSRAVMRSRSPTCAAKARLSAHAAVFRAVRRRSTAATSCNGSQSSRGLAVPSACTAARISAAPRCTSRRPRRRRCARSSPALPISISSRSYAKAESRRSSIRVPTSRSATTS